jgi:ADP-ribose pyrophosphatase YjhB (NUDIX family)
MQSIDRLRATYPDIEIVTVEQRLDEATFIAQKSKHEARSAEGGAIGTVWLDDGSFVLTKRSGLHAGWALIGGTVEQGEAFDEAFLREIREETGIQATISRVLLLEYKTFVSPAGSRLQMPVVLLEAIALEGQGIVETKEAHDEGLLVEAFNVHTIPQEMILKDREKLQLLIESRTV